MHIPFRVPFGLKTLFPGVLLFTIVSLELWPRAHSTGDDANPAPSEIQVEEQLANWAILDPKGFAAELEKGKTQEEFQAEALSMFAIINPVEFAEKHVAKDPAKLREEQRAELAIINPLAAMEEAEKGKSEEKKLEEAAARQDILNPRAR